MLTSSKRTSPATAVPGINSCMRFKHLSIVLLPHPDGPMMAVTVLAGNSSDTSRTARCWPKNAVSLTVSSRSRVLADATIPGPGDPARDERNDQYQSHENECGRPRQAMPFLIGAGRVYVDLKRQRLHRLTDVCGEIEIAERGEEQGRGLTSDPGDPDQAAGDNAAERRAPHDLERGAPARVTEGERGLAERIGDEAHHLLGRAREH